MWKVTNVTCDEEETMIILVDTEDEEFWIEVDKYRFQVLEDYGLIKEEHNNKYTKGCRYRASTTPYKKE